MAGSLQGDAAQQGISRLSALTVTFAPASLALETEWRTLEAQADRSVFLSWTYISTAIGLVGQSLLAARIHNGERLVALCLLWPIVETRHRVLRLRQLRLNEYGSGAQDRVCSEFTAPLIVSGFEDRAWAALIDALIRRGGWDEFIVTNLIEHDLPRLKADGVKQHLRARSGSGLVDLDALRAGGAYDLDGYLATRGKSTRSAIARSMRLYAERGVLRLERARGVRQSLEWFSEIASLQTAKWRARGRRGMDDFTFARAFMERLIENAAPCGAIEILRLSAGDEPLAWLCNHVDRRKVFFNIGGFAVEADNRLKPGLVAHAMAIADHLQSDMAVYDFMAGDDRYKVNLGEGGPNFVAVALQRPRLALRVEDALRAVKRRLRSAPQTPSENGAP